MKQLLLLLLLSNLLISCGDDSCSLGPARCHVYTVPSCEELRETYDPIIDALNDIVFPISGSNPDLPLDELSALDAVIRDAQWVGLGEATHGTLEFFEMKDRLFRYLVDQHGFKAIGFEATWGGGLHVNEYVLNGKGTAREAIGKMQFWTWNTEEVLTLVEWMRSYNEGKADADKIHFYGFDVQSGIEELYWLKNFLDPIDIELKQEIVGYIEPFVDRANFSSYSDLLPSEQNAYRQDIKSAQLLYQDNKDLIVNAAGETQYNLYEHAFEVLLMFEDILDRTSGNNRDYYMAKNSEWITDHLGSNAKVALWAHNFHVAKAALGSTQGNYLQESVGDAYKNIGFSFSRGTFQARFGDQNILTTDNEINSVECETANQILDDVDIDNYYILTEELLSEKVLSEYFDNVQDYLELGALFSGDSKDHFFPNNIVESFDVLIHFSDTNAAKPL